MKVRWVIGIVAETGTLPKWCRTFLSPRMIMLLESYTHAVQHRPQLSGVYKITSTTIRKARAHLATIKPTTMQIAFVKVAPSFEASGTTGGLELLKPRANNERETTLLILSICFSWFLFSRAGNNTIGLPNIFTSLSLSLSTIRKIPELQPHPVVLLLAALSDYPFPLPQSITSTYRYLFRFILTSFSRLELGFIGFCRDIGAPNHART